LTFAERLADAARQFGNKRQIIRVFPDDFLALTGKEDFAV
jgi:hypothetical protein